MSRFKFCGTFRIVVCAVLALFSAFICCWPVKLNFTADFRPVFFQTLYGVCCVLLISEVPCFVDAVLTPSVFALSASSLRVV